MSRNKTDPGKKERKLQKKLEKKYAKLEKKLRALELKLRKLGSKKTAPDTARKVGKRRKKEQGAESESGSAPISPNVVTLPTDQ
jgi:hypothetical protein